MEKSDRRFSFGTEICSNQRSAVGELFLPSETRTDVFSLSRPGRLDMYFSEEGLLCNACKLGSLFFPEPSQPIFVSYKDIMRIEAASTTMQRREKRTAYQIYFTFGEKMFSGILCISPEPNFESEFRRILKERSGVVFEEVVINKYYVLELLRFFGRLVWTFSPFVLVVMLLLWMLAK